MVIGIFSLFMWIVVLGILFVMVGFVFKLFVVLFYFWCLDVFEGVLVEVVGFFLVVFKVVVFGLLVWFCLVFVGGEMEVIWEL